MPAEIGQPAPEFTLRDQSMNEVSLDDLKGKNSLIVFIPFPFTRVCHGELCAIRDDFDQFMEAGTNVVSITCDTMFVNGHWAEEEGYNFPILSDYWPHGEVSRAYGCFDERIGAAKRYTYVLDAEGIVRDIVKSDELGEAREHGRYHELLAEL